MKTIEKVQSEIADLQKEATPTCLWLYGLPDLKPTNIVEGREQRIFKMPPDKKGSEGERAKERSKTFPGIAKAMAEQWG